MDVSETNKDGKQQTVPELQDKVRFLEEKNARLEQEQEKLREDMELLQRMFNYAPDAYYMTDLSGRFIDGNRIAQELVGYGKDELVGKSFFKAGLLSSDQFPKAASLLARNAVGQSTGPDEFKLQRKDGSEVWVEISTYPVKPNGSTMVLGIARDITMRRQAESRIQHERDRAQKYLDVAGVIMVVLNKHGEITLINRKGCEILGSKESKLLGKNWFDNFVPECERKKTKEVFHKLIEGRIEPIEYFENSVLTCDGERIIAWHNTLLRDEDGRITGTLSSGTDITEQKQAEQVLRQRDATIRAIVETSRDWIWACDNQGVTTYSNKAIEDILGYSQEEIIGSSIFNHIHPDDIESVEKELPNWNAERESWSNLTIRWLHKDGSIRFLESSAVPTFDDEGNHIGYRGVDRDITDHMLFEQALQESEYKYRMLIENINDIPYSMNASGELTFIGPQVQRYGIKPEDMLSGGFWEFIHPEDRKKLKADIEQTLARSKEFTSSFRLLDKQGNVHWIEEEGRIQRDEFGALVGVSGMLRDSTERKQAEIALKNSEEQYRSFFETARDGAFVTTMDGRFLDCNQELVGLLGYRSRTEMMKVKVPTLYANPDDRSKVIEEITEKGFASMIPVRLRKKDGTVIHALLTAAVLKNEDGTVEGLQGTLTDITERVQAEEAAERERTRCKTLIEASLDGIAVINQEHKVIEANHRFAEMLGYNDEEVLDLHTWDWEANMSEKEIKGNFADLSKTRAVFETIHRRKDGSTYFAEVSASGAMVHGESMVFTVTRDITERKEAKRIKSEFDAQKQVVKRLEELDRMKDEFVSTVTHELRTPMTPLKSTIEMLLDGSLGEITPEQKKFVEMMGRNVERLAQFTTEVLTLSRLESRRYRLAPKTLSLLQAMEPVMELMNAKAGSRKSKIILDVAPELCVYADEDSLGMVVTNLTNNAIVHTPKQSQITVSARQVADDRVEVSVSDNGEGIPEEHLGRLFDRFYQAKRRDSAQYKGTGIGLAVCKALVEAMGGEISVESQLGEGTTFRFTLPAQSENPSKEE